MSLELGQVLWLRIRFNQSGDISSVKHPYLVMSRDDAFNIIEVGQIDSLEGKEYKAAFKCNKPIYCTDPNETVIYKDSFLQMDNKFILEDYPGLEKYRRTTDKLSEEKYRLVRDAYFEYQRSFQISEEKMVYLDAKEIESLNS